MMPLAHRLSSVRRRSPECRIPCTGFARRPGSAPSPAGCDVSGFLVQTERGVLSLALANVLARREGVLLSSRNWQGAVATR